MPTESKRNDASRRPDISNELHFPKRYWIVTRWLPLGIALLTGVTIAMALTGFFALPAGLGVLEGLSAFTASLEGISFAATVTAAVGAISTLTYVVSSLLAGGLTSSTAEKIAINNQHENSMLGQKLMSKSVKIDDLKEEHRAKLRRNKETHQAELQHFEAHLQKMTTKYDRLVGAHKGEKIISSEHESDKVQNKKRTRRRPKPGKI